ncbi:MAG: hypothetical protein J6Y26_02605, partial [Lachnospiraceae bacterium]|nr:hypothetical protein [Lachnospiraceae bacterium]
MITFMLFTLLASYLIFQCVSALLGMPKVLEDRFEKVNGAHVEALAGNSPEETEAWTKAFTENEHIVDFETVPFVNMYGQYRNVTSDDFEEYSFYAEPYTTTPRIMNLGLSS